MDIILIITIVSSLLLSIHFGMDEYYERAILCMIVFVISAIGLCFLHKFESHKDMSYEAILLTGKVIPAINCEEDGGNDMCEVYERDFDSNFKDGLFKKNTIIVKVESFRKKPLSH